MTDPFYAGGGIGFGPRPEVTPADPYPAPIVSSRDGVQGPTKSAVAGLTKLAERYGWSVLVTYAKGFVQHGSTGKPSPAPRESLAVRMQRPGGYMVAVYVDHGSSWSWDTLWVAGENPRPFRQIGAFMDAVFGSVCSTAPWHPPYIYPGQGPDTVGPAPA